MTENKQFYTTRDIARLFNKERWEVLQWVKIGVIPEFAVDQAGKKVPLVKRIGKGYLFSEAAVRILKERQNQEPDPEAGKLRDDARAYRERMARKLREPKDNRISFELKQLLRVRLLVVEHSIALARTKLYGEPLPEGPEHRFLRDSPMSAEWLLAQAARDVIRARDLIEKTEPTSEELIQELSRRSDSSILEQMKLEEQIAELHEEISRLREGKGRHRGEIVDPGPDFEASGGKKGRQHAKTKG